MTGGEGSHTDVIGEESRGQVKVLAIGISEGCWRSSWQYVGDHAWATRQVECWRPVMCVGDNVYKAHFGASHYSR